MDIISWLLARKYCDNSIKGISGVLSGKNCTIDSATKSGNLTTVIFKWTADDGTTRTTQIEVKDGETPAFSSVAITGGHRLTFTTQDPTQSVSFNVMDGAKGDTGISVVASNVDDNNNLTLTLSNGNVINAGKIKAVTTIDNTLSTTSSNPVENKVITNALNNKVDKEMGKGLFSDEEKAKLANIEDGAQVNVLEKLIVNGQEATITDKSIALTIITSAVSNLQNYYLKTETYTKQEVEDLIGSTVGVTIEIVEQLPTEGQSNVIYFLPTETEGVYSQYIYSNNSWILIGSTTVDLSNYYTKAQVDTLLNGKQNVLTIDSFPTPLSNNPVASGGVYTAIAQMQPQFQFANMPTASSTNLGFVYQYTGATGTYTQNMFYRCIYDDTLGEYRWEEVIFHATVTVDSAISGTSTNPVQNKVIKEALDTKQDIMQYSTMPSAQDNLGKIVQYIGTNTANYTNGYFYKAIYNSESDVYLWTVIKFSADMLVDNALSTTSENPVQNKVITGAINDIQDVIPSEASDTNQLVDRDSLGTASQKNFTSYVSPDNADVPISSSVYRAITSAVYGAYHPSGSKTIAELTSDLLVLANIGNVYKITEDGVTTDLFIGGAGQTIHTGDNAVVVYGGQPNTFLFDLQSGSIDLTPYQTKTLESAVEGQTTVEGALSALSTNKATQAEVNDMNNVLGAKNLIPYPYHRQNGYTTNGATFTYDDEGVITVNKVAGNATAYFGLFSNTLYPNAKNFLEPNTSYILSMELEDATSTSCFIQTQNGIDLAAIRNKATGKYEISFTTPETMDFLAVSLYYGAATTENNAKVKLMIRLASIQDDTYEPYSKTNRELTIDKAEQAEVNDIVNVYGAKNLLSYPYYESTKTVNGITFTDNGDGTLTLDGTATARITYEMTATASYNLLEIGKKYLISFKTSDDTIDSNSWALRIYCKKDSVTVLSTTDSRGSDVAFTVPEETVGANVQFIIVSGTVLNNVVIKPMIRLASIQDDTWVPYVPTNKELMSCKLNGYVGAKNLLPYPYKHTTKSENGVTFTDNGDGTITVNTPTSASAETTFYLSQSIQSILDTGMYILSGCPSGGNRTSGYFMEFAELATSSSDWKMFGTDTGEGAIAHIDSTRYAIHAYIRIRSGATVSNLTFKPMIRRVEDTDPTWQPYAKTNRELTDVIPSDASASNKLVTESDLTYSTSETNTGKTWIDGKPIYRKVINLGTLPNNDTKGVNHGITNINQFVNVRGFGTYSSSAICIPLPYSAAGADNKDRIGIYANAQSVVVSCPTYDFSAYIGTAILEYTKTTD